MRAQLGKKRIDLPMDALGAPSPLEMSNIPQPKPMPPQMGAQPLIPGEWMGGTPEPAMPMEEDPYAGQISGIEGQLNALNNPPPEPLWKKIANLGRGITTMDPAEFQRQGHARIGQEFQQKTQREQMLRNQLTDVQNRKRQSAQDAQQAAYQNATLDETRRLRTNQENAEARQQAEATRKANMPTVETRRPGDIVITRDASGAETGRETMPTAPPAINDPFDLWLQQMPDAPIADYYKMSNPPAPRAQQFVVRNGQVIPIQPGTAQPGDVPYDPTAARQENAGPTPQQITNTIQEMIRASTDIAGRFDPAKYEQQRQMLSRSLGVELEKYPATAAPATKPNPGMLSNIGRGSGPGNPPGVKRKYEIGKLETLPDGTQAVITGFDEDGEPLALEIGK